MNRLALFSAVVSFAFLPLSLSAQEPASAFETIRETARKLGDTEEGKAYEKQFGKDFGPSMQAALQTCTEATKPPYKLNIVYVIAIDGTVERAVPDQGQPVSVCVAEKVKGTKLAPPPKAGWLVSVSIAINE